MFDYFVFVFEQAVSISLIACMIVMKQLFIDMYDYSAEMNEMIVLMVALYLVGYENIFELLFLYLGST